MLDIAQKNKDYTLVSWGAQGPWKPISVVRGEGVYIWDADGKRYLDGLAGLFVSQVGHGRAELADAAADDQARVVTPLEAVRMGADYLVIGRPITQSKDPVATLESIRESLQETRPA